MIVADHVHEKLNSEFSSFTALAIRETLLSLHLSQYTR